MMKRGATLRASLLGLIRRYSYRYDPEGGFQLVSGKTSRHYIDCKATTMRGDAAESLGALVAELVPSGVIAVGGLTMGADPIALAAASYSTRQGRALNAFSVRKEAKGHGLRKWIEGSVEPGSLVAVVDDVVTTGGSTILAMKRCREGDLRIAAVIVLVDRQEEHGIESIRREAGPETPVAAIFTLDDVRSEADP